MEASFAGIAEFFEGRDAELCGEVVKCQLERVGFLQHLVSVPLQKLPDRDGSGRNTQSMKAIHLLALLILPLLSRADEAPFELRRVLPDRGAASEELLLKSGESEERLFVERTALITTGHVAAANVGNSSDGTPQIFIKFSKLGAKRFAEVTRKAIGQRLAFVVEGTVLTAPLVVEEIRGGTATIAGRFDLEEARRIAKAIQPRKPKKVVQ